MREWDRRIITEALLLASRHGRADRVLNGSLDHREIFTELW